MAMERKRSGKEARKPKGDKKPAVSASVSWLMARSGPLGRMPKAISERHHA